MAKRKKRASKKKAPAKKAAPAKSEGVGAGVFLTIYGAVWFLMQGYRPDWYPYMLPLLVFLVGLKMLFFE